MIEVRAHINKCHPHLLALHPILVLKGIEKLPQPYGRRGDAFNRKANGVRNPKVSGIDSGIRFLTPSDSWPYPDRRVTIGRERQGEH